MGAKIVKICLIHLLCIYSHTKFIIMKRLFVKVLLTLAIAVAQTAHAQKVDIYPVPQNAEWKTEVAFSNNATFALNGEANADTCAVALFKKKFKTGDTGVKVIIGEKNDAAVAEYANLIPQKAEGYYLATSKDEVIIAGYDESGTYYGVQTFVRMASQPNVMCATITDYPSVPQRGLVEGFYGNPYSEANRMSLFEMFGEMKMNVYIYGPKDDVYHRGKWREEYPAELGKKITEYVNAAKANKVEFVWAIHPGEDIQWNETDRINIVNKLKAMCKLGVRAFSVFWDDLWNDDGTNGDEQAELMNYITEELAKEYPDVKPLVMCPTQYNRGWANTVYLPDLGRIMKSDINVMWTGNTVVDMINKSDVEWINNQIKRKAYIWLNYPVSDYCIDHLLMGPTYGNDKNIADMLSGFVSNPMEYAEASKVSLFSIADYTWNMPAYDSDASWDAAIRYIMPENYEAFRFFCENNVDLGANVHGLRRTDESPEFKEAKNTFNSNIKNDRAKAYAAIEAQFDKLVASAETMLTTDEAEALTSEIKPWIQAMKYLGERGGCIIDMNNALNCENPDSFVNSYLRYQQLTVAQSALRSRDFDGALRTATPSVGSVHVEPFLKEAVGTLVAEYKEVYDYRTDVFPAQVLDNGTYNIMYNGKYLTNRTQDSNNSAPVFQKELDVIRPQRQEWKISVDPSTNRYKIINILDERYINENGEFTVSNETNPYEAVWHTYSITQLANGKYAIKNGGSAGNDFWNVEGERIKKNGTNALPSQYVFDLVPLGGNVQESFIENGGIYYIMDGKKLLTNTKSDTPKFETVDTPTKAQEWKITIDSNGKDCYKIVSNDDQRYMNEYGVFGTNQYYSDWNTYLLTRMGDNWSIQWTQSATTKDGVKYLVVSGDRLEAKSVAENESYTVKIIAKENYTSVKNIDKYALTYNGTAIYADDAECIEIYSIDGRIIKQSNEESITTAEFTSGVYIAVARYSNDVEVLRFTVK